MPSIFTILDISRWALQASTRQLDTVSHNVANVSTPGYSRQETVVTTRNPERTAEGWYGHGVRTVNVIQHVDKLIQDRLTDKTSDFGVLDSRLNQLTRLQALANEAGETGLGQAITAFFSAWQDLANNPESTAVRHALAQTGANLASRLSTVYQDVGAIARDMDTYLSTAVGEVNNICRRIASLNDQIMATEASGKSANDYRDERQRQLEALSQKMNIQWFEDGRGAVTVFAGMGKTLVQDNYPRPGDPDPLGFAPVAGYDSNQIVWSQQGQVLDLSEITGGEISGWLRVRDVDVAETQDFLNDLTKTLIGQVNLVHSQGAGLAKLTDVTGTYQSVDDSTGLNETSNDLPFKDLLTSGTLTIWVYDNGTRRSYDVNIDPSRTLNQIVADINAVVNPLGDANLNPLASVEGGNRLRIQAGSGIEFAFGRDTSGLLAAMGINTFFDGYSANNVALNAQVGANVRLIAAGRITADGEHALGDNRNALDLADLKDADTMGGGAQTFNEAIISWSAELGATIANLADNRTFAEASKQELLNLRDQVSAVNLDEEMVKLIQYQRGYQMAAKLISVADQLLVTLMDVKR
ncbi:MAG: flagellar hook-associated protein FlgK [Thermodesulfobacteriota bacterium]